MPEPTVAAIIIADTPLRPAPIEAGANPGALVTVVRTPEGVELDRWLLTLADPTAGVAEAQVYAVQGHTIVICDGDTGEAVASLGVG
jgi:hypothetical protein